MKNIKPINLIIGIVALIVVGASLYIGNKANSVQVLEKNISVEKVQQAVDIAEQGIETEPVQDGTFTKVQVAVHATEASCYTAIGGKVYDVSAFIREHPGGSKEILRICGKDGTRSFNSEHSKDMNAKALLADFQIGVLVD